MVLRIEDALARLHALASQPGRASEQRVIALALRNELRAASQRSSAEAIALFLESGRDAATGLAFAPLPDGFLETAPSLRTLLLDELERLDPARALEAAEVIFGYEPAVADEWAVALRITARANGTAPPATPAKFIDQVHAYLGNPAWLATPTAGFLHGFDAAVFSGNPALVPRLADVTKATQPTPVQFAARLALDRLVMRNYADVAGHLADHPALLAHDATFRGVLFARADVSDARQRAVLERYLVRTGSTTAELAAWAAHFPHRSKHISHNLLTRDGPYPIAELARMDRAALAVVREWRADPAMADAHELLGPVLARLEKYVASADRGDAARAPAP